MLAPSIPGGCARASRIDKAKAFCQHLTHMEKLPSKEDLRKKYNITEEDFQAMVQPSLPTPESLQAEQAYIQKLGYWDRFEVWCKKTILGNLVLAVILIGGILQGFEYINKYSKIIYADGQQLIAYVDDYAQHAKEKPFGYVVQKDTPPSEEDKHQPDPIYFTTGSAVYPASGNWS